MDNSDKEVEVAKFMVSHKKSESDTRAEDIEDVNENDAFVPDDVMMTDTKTEEEDESDGGEVVTQVDLVEHVEEPGEDEQTYYRTQGGQMLPINVKSELEDEATVELIQCDDQNKSDQDEPEMIEEVVADQDTFITYTSAPEQQQIIINKADQHIFTTAQSTQPVITYVDEPTGISIGQPNATGSMIVETPNTAGSSSPKKRLISTPVNNGQQKQFILPSANNMAQGQQIIQIAGQNGQPGQMIIVPSGNIILLPSQNGTDQNNGIQTLRVVSPNQSIQQSQPQQQQQQIVILSNPEQNQPQFIQQHIQEPSPPQRINNKKPKYVKVATNQQSSIEYAANVAGITGQSQGQTINADGTLALKTGQSSQVVSSQHHYPSPFSQVPVEERPHSCTFCYKRFARADECKRHERIHTDTRPFGCTYCPRRFTRKDHLRTHTRCHTKEKPYICPLCSRGFARSDERIRHVKTHVKKGEGTLEEIKAQMPKPKFDPKPKQQFKAVSGGATISENNRPMSIEYRSAGGNNQSSGNGQQQQATSLLQIAPSPAGGDSGNQITKIIQIPISSIGNGNQIQIQPMTQE